ncbi:MAG: hypothetical protein ACYTBJ_01485 [Planctomycetota bacterium]|jgi:hypothetical protein
MPLQVRQIAVCIAVIFFFAIGLIGCLSGLAPFTCCKRSITGAVLAYIATVLAVRIINTILMSAMITRQMDREREKAGAGGN